MNYENSKTLCLQLNNRRNPYLRKRQSPQEMCGNHQPTRQEILWLSFAVGVRSSGYGQAYRQGKRSDGSTTMVRGGNPSFFLFGRRACGCGAPSFCQQTECTKFSFEICIKLPIDFFLKLWYNNYRKQERCSSVERIPPSVPPHPFESGSPSFGLCLRLGRQRDDVRSSRTADKKILKNFKKVLTNCQKCGIINITNQGKR